MDVPALSSEERAEAWAKAAAIRKARSNLLAAVQAGELTVSDVLEQAETSAIVSKTRVSVVMKALPGAHAMWATRILEQLSIADAQRIGGLSAKQRHALRGITTRRFPKYLLGNDRPSAGFALNCSTIGAAISEFLEGLSPAHNANSADDEGSVLDCLWTDEHHIKVVNVVVRSRATSPAEMERIRAGKVYTGDYPRYKIVDTDRLRAANAVGAMMVDPDPVGKHEVSEMQDIIIRTPQLQVEGLSWKAPITIEIGTRVAELIASDN
ncbi:integration host factor, actinobacterial type [Rhodococcus sp. ZPP]|uniref:integration host factor, actinobacterial type n=1 Tax=Rhodococcus sp. ZPP TaxID=2749906 RepID=UPI003297E2C2